MAESLYGAAGTNTILQSNYSPIQKKPHTHKQPPNTLTGTYQYTHRKADIRKSCHQFSSRQSLSRVQHSVTPWTAACRASLSITNSQSLLKLISIELVMLSNHLILWCPLLLSPSIFPTIRVFSNESVPHIRWPKCWSFSFSISPSNEYSGLISFRMDWFDLLADWFDLLAVQGNLKCLLQHHSSKAKILLLSEELWSNSHIRA